MPQAWRRRTSCGAETSLPQAEIHCRRQEKGKTERKLYGKELQENIGDLCASVCQRTGAHRSSCRCLRAGGHICQISEDERGRRALHLRFGRAWCAYHHQGQEARLHSSGCSGQISRHHQTVVCRARNQFRHIFQDDIRHTSQERGGVFPQTL